MKTPGDITKDQLIMALTELRTRIDELQTSEEDKMKQWDELSRTKAISIEGSEKKMGDEMVRSK